MNDFFRKLYSNPMLMWALAAGVLFIGLGLFVYFDPRLTGGMESGTRKGFAAIMLVYGIYRLITGYAGYKKIDRD